MADRPLLGAINCGEQTPHLTGHHQPAKTERLRWLIAELPLTPLLQRDYPTLLAVEEHGTSFVENAALKAVAAAQVFGGLAIASDGGVVIPALGETWDALRTGRAAGPTASDEERARHLLTLMDGHAGEERRVQWHEAVALADGGGMVQTWEAAGTEGYLTEEYDPANAVPGFWVYSLWRFPALGKRYVDLTPEELAALDTTWGRLREQLQAWWQADGRAGSASFSC